MEARYRKGRKPDGTVIYGSVYGKTYEEAERKRAELLQGLELQYDRICNDFNCFCFKLRRVPANGAKLSRGENVTESYEIYDFIVS